MGGVFGVVSKDDCVNDVFFGTDYHSHLGTRRGGMAVRNAGGIVRFIHDISNAPFRSKFEPDLPRMHGRTGVGVISDTEDQPLIIGSHLGIHGIVSVGKVQNADALAEEAFRTRGLHFSEMSGEEVNASELLATIISGEATFEDGIRRAQEAVQGSCSLLLLTDRGIYAGRDRLGRTPLILGEKPGAFAVASESCAFPNTGFTVRRDLGPGEVVLLTPDGIEMKKPELPRSQICAFLWVYYGFPASTYEGINVEAARNRCGAALARRESAEIDVVAGIPDSGIAHAIGYAAEAHVPYRRPFVKYTPTWPRSFMPQDQAIRDLVAKMKLIPIKDLIRGQRLLFCEDSIVRGTQLKDTIQILFECGAREVHMRPACPPLVYACKFLNFSRSKSELDLAARKAIAELEPVGEPALTKYADPDSPEHAAMVDRIRRRLGLTTLQYQRLPDMVEAIGLPKDRLCTYCWDGAE
ncbi:MAG: amidophosphoribosyltransferase [Planctomycetes bacterium]|nr:amidophosphoribosyltransferase [Planctomycetota bacterium]